MAKMVVLVRWVGLVSSVALGKLEVRPVVLVRQAGLVKPVVRRVDWVKPAESINWAVRIWRMPLEAAAFSVPILVVRLVALRTQLCLAEA